MATYVYDSKTGKVVLESERTDRGERSTNRSTHIEKQFPGGIRIAQLASSPWDNSDACMVYSTRDLDRKAAAQGMVANRVADEGREAHQGKAPTWNRDKNQGGR